MGPFERRYRPEYAYELVEIAQGDLDSAEALAAAARGRRENVLYLSHQVVEKCLKALICHGGQPVTHRIQSCWTLEWTRLLLARESSSPT
ncbi:MAG: HEPN domain-containing protein [Silvanigrellales bacterium]|nr:HEPN domain-containing protein [Silvanigrellales bacterium]